MIISDRVRDLLNKVLPLFEQITFGDIIQKMQQDIAGGGGGGFDGLDEFVVNTSTGNIDSIPAGTGPEVVVIFTGAAPVLQGIAAGADGKRVTLKKVGAGSLIVKFSNSGTAADNIATVDGADIEIQSGRAMELVYTSAAPGWVQVGSAEAPSTGGATSADVIYDPDIAATDGNRYKTWAEVMTAITAAPLFVDLYIHKAGIFQTATVPAGAYNLSKVAAIKPTPQSIVPNLAFLDGATLTGLPFAVWGATIENRNTGVPLFTVAGFNLITILDGSIKNSATATQPAISIPAGATFTLNIDSELAPLYSDPGGSEVIFNEGTLGITLKHVPDSSFMGEDNVFTNGLSGVGSISMTSYVLLEGGYTGTHANYDGSLNITQKAETRVNEIRRENIFVFDPLGPQTGNRFNDFAVLYTAFAARQDMGQRTIEFVGNVTIPAGSYPGLFDNVVWRGKSASGSSQSEVTLAADVTGTGFRMRFESIYLKCANTIAPVVAFNNSGGTPDGDIETENFDFENTGSQPFGTVQGSSGGLCNVRATGGFRLVTGVFLADGDGNYPYIMVFFPTDNNEPYVTNNSFTAQSALSAGLEFVFPQTQDPGNVSQSHTNMEVFITHTANRGGADRHEERDHNGFGSTATKVMRFVSTVDPSLDNAGFVTVADSAVNGFSATLNKHGIYFVRLTYKPTAASWVGISKNASVLTDNIQDLAETENLGAVESAGQQVQVTYCGRLQKNDVIRAHTDGVGTLDAARTRFDIQLIRELG
jgi:hypothetical protein